MKNLFGFDAKTKSANNSAFVIRDLDGAEGSHRLEEITQINLAARKKAALPIWLQLIEGLAYFAGLILLTVGIPDADAVFTQAHLIFLIVGGVLFVFSIILFAISRLRIKKLGADPYFQQSLAREDKLTDEVLKVPESAEKIHILVVDRQVKFPVYRMVVLKVFKENGLLCFSDNSQVTGIPLSQVMTAYAVNAKTRFFPMQSFNKETCVQYGMKRSVNYGGQYIIQSRLVVELQLNGEQYEIVVAGYNAQAFTKFLDTTTVIVQ